MFTLKKAVRLNLSDQLQQRVQNNLADAIDQTLQSNVSDGVLIQGVAVIANTPVNVKHGMGRPITHVEVCNSIGSYQVIVSRTSSTSDPNYITIVPSASGTIDLWIY
jgi:hypothetical protein